MDQPQRAIVELNQQQLELVDRLVQEGGHGTSRAEVIREVFRRFCQDHPELVEGRATRLT
jgi:metal-responsive CopG/Arc/MetJ family transcriptional regulator